MVPEGLDPELRTSSASSSKGMVQELTIEADLRLALDEEDPEETEDTVDMVEMGDMVDVRPDKELSPESEFEWLWWWT